MGKLYGTRKHGVMAHNGEVGGGGGSVIIDVNVSKLVYPAEEATTSSEVCDQNSELIQALLDQVSEAYSAGKNVYLRAWNDYDDEEKGITSQAMNTKCTFMLVSSSEYDGGVEAYLFASAGSVSDELALTTITCGSNPGDDPDFDIHNSGLYYSPWVE